MYVGPDLAHHQWPNAHCPHLQQQPNTNMKQICTNVAVDVGSGDSYIDGLLSQGLHLVPPILQ